MKLKIFLFLILCAILMDGFAQKVESDYPQKIDDKVRAIQISDMKFGMFICWSFSTFSGKEWTPTKGKDATYFKATGCNTDQWCKVAKKAGMGYILFLTKHHDGFCLWDTKTTDKRVTNSPLGIDVLAKLRKSCDKYGIKLALYFSEGDWTFPGAEFSKSGGSNPEIKKEQLKELLTKYGPIEYIWFDHAQGNGGLSHEETDKWVEQFQPNCLPGYNHGTPAGRIRLGEMGSPSALDDISGAGYNKHAGNYKGYIAAEFTYPILPEHKGGANWFYSLPEHDNLCIPAEKIFNDYLGAVKFKNIFSLDIGPDYKGELRAIDVKTLTEVGKMIKKNKVQTFYVSTLGNDANPGTKERPVSTFAQAQQLVRKLPQRASVKVLFAQGVYYLPETISFTDVDAKASVIYQAEEEGSAIISGGTLLKLEWKQGEKGIFAAKVEGNPFIDQLYINGKRQRMARFPNAVAGKNVFDTWDLSHQAKPDSANSPLSPERIRRWKNPEGGYIHAMHAALWGDMHWIIKGKNADGTLNYEGGWQNNRPSEMHPVYRMVENIFEELDSPGEWFFDRKEQKLYFMPEADVEMKTATVEIVRLKHLIEFNGTKENPVRNVHLEGFVFRHAARTFMENKEPLLRSDWTVYRGAALVYSGAEDCSVVDCEFDQVGGNTILVNNYNRRIIIKGCYIHHSGANGIAFVGDPGAVRSPIFRYGPQNFSAMDRTPGPKNDNYPYDCLVEDCLITLTGRDEKQTAPVHISMSHKIRVNHCSIYDVPRAGININEGTFGGHIIENCDVFNTVLETGDHGSFNSWGRDRFWSPDINQTVPEVAQNQNLPFLDILEPNIIRNNRWRCDHGWDIDLDDGSSWYRIYNNLLLNGGLKMREGYDRQATNNVIVNNSLHPHVWYPNSGDIFKSNIVCTAYRPAVMNRGNAADGKWGKELDYNFFAATAAEMNKFAQNGCDANSSFGDPLFVNPSTGDFRVKEGSTALNLGFANFPMNQFGVTKPSLKAIAKTPAIPLVTIKIVQVKSPDLSFVIEWLGAKLSEPAGDELSAFGAGFGDGGVSITRLDESSVLKKYLLKAGDLIQKINASEIKNTIELKAYLNANQKMANHTFFILRNQQIIEIKVNQILPVI